MIHFTCDCCGRAINQTSETRYVVRMEVYAALDDEAGNTAEEADHLGEIEDLLERMDDIDADLDEALYRHVRYDLCPDCRERFLRNPLGRVASRTSYSEN
ncbi:hypothetical protein [Botrimarina mediterranea]|uniref:Uncharacterized protein n=1 Tax=Botrimarina mediterranea TaxID=2528022 RepID=A0A518KC59_9BACT|nr:hypothetical protein [Botrimarina mediterranea]QDV75339.1 hypothetical protein Spa11_35540 [Botrimarina mediterranea]QDV80008.1 hypothetical protein K2D_36290 [Planctomycetes bacterium K2D]